MRTHRAAVLLLALLACAVPCRAEDEHPLCKDKTGIAWALPFKTALAKAKASSRLLMIKPVAFGTSRDGGW